MIHRYENKELAGELRLIDEEAGFDRDFFRRDREHKYLTIAWNRGAAQMVTVDEVKHDLPANSILPLMVNQSFRFSRPAEVTAWQFNRNFYCIVDHDDEVGCVGFLFYGNAQVMILEPDERETRKLELLLEVFKDEFVQADSIQNQMLRVLLVRLIIIVTRMAKAKYLDRAPIDESQFDLVRRFNLMVENHYRTDHSVGSYAKRLNKSPKTLSNYFLLVGTKTPLQLINERIVLEAKRLFHYTDKSGKEIAYELGFDDAAHFSRFFKKHTSQNPSEFRRNENL